MPSGNVFYSVADLVYPTVRNIFEKKHAVHCAVCGRQLGRHKYRPSEEWHMEGLLCGNCHIEKTKEFILSGQQDAKEEPDKCVVCGREITVEQDRNKPRWQWEMESGSLICRACYEKKDAQHSKTMNYCAMCNDKLGMIFYHPKPSWKIEGKLCRSCWDSRNNRRN